MSSQTLERTSSSTPRGEMSQTDLAETDSANAPAPARPRRYVLITPCRDEAKFARLTIESVMAQTVRPALWVIVDDGSKDETPAILAEYAARVPWIRVVRRDDRGDRKLGGGVIDAFYSGYETINPSDYDYVCKLDLDLILPPKYFELVIEKMEANPRIGTASGKPYFIEKGTGKVVHEVFGSENSGGFAKFYRTECFAQTGGFVRGLLWDGIDCHRCRQLGWITVAYDDPELSVNHLRPMGTSHKNWWTGRVRHGVGNYFMGTTPTYLLASAAFRLFKPPVIVGSAAIIWGYFRSMFQRMPRYGDAEFRRFLRNYQWAALFKGKDRAVAEINERQKSAWRVKPHAK
jgi:biofilm PGA synthesis N-glycosyltransferase PgaC